MTQENFQEFEISQLTGMAMLPTYAKTTLVMGINGDQPRMPKILSKKLHNRKSRQLELMNSASNSKSQSRSLNQSKSLRKSRETPKTKLPNQYHLHPNKEGKSQITFQIKTINSGGWKSLPSHRKLTTQQMRQQIYKKQLQQCTFQPKISHRSRQLISSSKNFHSNTSRRTFTKEGVFDRLNKKNKQTSFSQTPTQLIENTNRRLRRQSPIQNYLYSDALRRRERQSLVLRRNLRNEAKNDSTNNLRMQKMAGQKFVKEFALMLQKLNIHQQKFFSLIQIHKILNNLSFIHTKKLSDDHPQNTLIYQLFQILAGNVQNGVRVKNLLMFLLAVSGIFNVQQVNLYDPIKTNIQDINTQSQFGIIVSQQGTLVMTEGLGSKIHKYFDVMYRNRLSRNKVHDKPKGKENQYYQQKNQLNKKIKSNAKNLDKQGMKSRQSKKNSAAVSKRSSHTNITQNKKIIPEVKKSELPLIHIPNPTHQTNMSQFSQQTDQTISLQKIFNLKNHSQQISLQIELKNGQLKNLIIKSSKHILQAVQLFCEMHFLDKNSKEQILQVAYQAYQNE